MNTFTQIIGLPVVSVHSCQKIGIVLNMQLNKDKTRFTNLIVADDEDDLVYLLPIKMIYGIGDCVLIRNSQALSITNELIYPNLINLEAFGLSGTSYGTIKDIEIDTHFKIISFVANSTLNSKKLIHFNYNLAIFNDLDKKLRLSNFAPKSIVPKNIEITNQSTVSIVDSVENENISPDTINTNIPMSTISTPKTITARLPNSFKNPY